MKPQVPDFTPIAQQKLDQLIANGYQITGFCFERLVDGSQPQRGFVDFGGFVGWWKPENRGAAPTEVGSGSGADPTVNS